MLHGERWQRAQRDCIAGGRAGARRARGRRSAAVGRAGEKSEVLHGGAEISASREMIMFGFIGVLVVIGVLLLFSAIKILPEYQRGVVLTLGRYTGTKGPGLMLLIPVVQRMIRVDLRVNVMDVPPQDVISRDNVSVRVNAVVYFRVVDSDKCDAAGRGFLAGDQPAGADAAAFCAGPARTGRDPVAARLDQPHAADDPRRGDRRRGASRSPTSRSRMSTSTRPWSARLPARPRPSANAAPR